MKSVIYFADTPGGTNLGALYIGAFNELGTIGITDFRYLLDNSQLIYHNVKRIDYLDAGDQCMTMHTSGGSNPGITWSAGEWMDTSCASKKAAMCEGNKVGTSSIYSVK